MPALRKERTVRVRVTKPEAERFADAAEREGLTSSEWIRRLAERRIRELAAGLARPGELPPAA